LFSISGKCQSKSFLSELLRKRVWASFSTAFGKKDRLRIKKFAETILLFPEEAEKARSAHDTQPQSGRESIKKTTITIQHLGRKISKVWS